MSVKRFAAVAGSTPQRLGRIMRGEILMRLEDLAAADLILGEISGPARGEAERQRGRTESDRARVEEIVRATLAVLREESTTGLMPAPEDPVAPNSLG